jgi:hypothetical protein
MAGDERRFSLPEALVSMVLFGGVGGFLFRPPVKFENAVHLRDYSPFAKL